MPQEDNHKNSNSLSSRLEKLVSTIERAEKILEKKLSFKYAFARGLMQGLGIVIGSTILAGLLYAVLVKFISPELIQKWTLEAVIERSK